MILCCRCWNLYFWFFCWFCRKQVGLQVGGGKYRVASYAWIRLLRMVFRRLCLWMWDGWINRFGIGLLATGSCLVSKFEILPTLKFSRTFFFLDFFSIKKTPWIGRTKLLRLEIFVFLILMYQNHASVNICRIVTLAAEFA